MIRSSAPKITYPPPVAPPAGARTITCDRCAGPLFDFEARESVHGHRLHPGGEQGCRQAYWRRYDRGPLSPDPVERHAWERMLAALVAWEESRPHECGYAMAAHLVPGRCPSEAEARIAWGRE